MPSSRTRHLPSLHLKILPVEVSSRPSSVLSDWDDDDDDDEDNHNRLIGLSDLPSSRPLSLSMPPGPYCPQIPTLQEVLSNTAPPPWTLSAFMAYLSQNHCLETLEFTMDAARYEKQYNNLMARAPFSSFKNQSPECAYVQTLWRKLLDAYIVPNSPREVNLPSDVRDRLVSLPYTNAPPDPTELLSAVKIIYELMDESVLVPFLHAMHPSRGPESCTSPWALSESMLSNFITPTTSLDESSGSTSKFRRESSPPHDVSSSPRSSYHSPVPPTLRSTSRLSNYVVGTSSTPFLAGETPDSPMDDSNEASSPSGSAREPVTPPNTPPTSHLAFPEVLESKIAAEYSSWKKMGVKLGWKKSSRSGSGASTGSSRHHHLYHSSREASEDGL